MKKLLLVLLVSITSCAAMAQTAPNVIGEWKGVSNSAVFGFGMFHPTERGKEKSVRYRNVEYVLSIDRQEGRNFSGFIQNISKKRREVVLGAFAKDLKSGVMVNENGTFHFTIFDDKEIDICYTQVVPHAATTPRVASCFEMTKQQ